MNKRIKYQNYRKQKDGNWSRLGKQMREINPQKKCFICLKSNRPVLEKHHLFGYQNLFHETTEDVVELCAFDSVEGCHKKAHYYETGVQIDKGNQQALATRVWELRMEHKALSKRILSFRPNDFLEKIANLYERSL